MPRVELLQYPDRIPESLTSCEIILPIIQQPRNVRRSLTYNQWINEYEEHLFRMYGEVRRVIADRHPSLKPRDAYAQFCKLVYYSSSGYLNTV